MLVISLLSMAWGLVIIFVSFSIKRKGISGTDRFSSYVNWGAN